MTKVQANRMLYKVYKMLREVSMQFRLNRKLEDYGVSMTINNDPSLGGAIIEIDPQKKEFAGNCLHECLHLTLPQASETKIAQLERSMMVKLTDRQLLNLLKRVLINS